MYRIAVRHTDPDHPNAAVFQWREPFTTAEDATAALRALAEEGGFTLGAGYTAGVQQLVVDAEAGSAEWRDA